MAATALADANVTAVRLSFDFAPHSLYAGYDKGMLQMMNSPKPFYGAPAGNPLPPAPLLRARGCRGSWWSGGGAADGGRGE
eukprot:COSAG01_NODE_2071_length_8496_cov_5.773252_4_plen_81_part_00